MSRQTLGDWLYAEEYGIFVRFINHLEPVDTVKAFRDVRDGNYDGDLEQWLAKHEPRMHETYLIVRYPS